VPVALENGDHVIDAHCAGARTQPVTASGDIHRKTYRVSGLISKTYLIHSISLLTCSLMGTNTGCADAGNDGPQDPGLTPRRRKIIRAIEESVRSRGYPPSLREIGEAVGLASASSASHQVRALKALGYISREEGRPRTAVLRPPGGHGGTQGAATPWQMADVPLVGRIAAGAPVIADQLAELADEVICLPRMLTGEGSLIALRVTGDSMTGAAIADGDWVVVRQQPDAANGDIVAAMLPAEGSADWEATVKTLKRSGGHAWLLPHNPAYTPIPADSAVIIGRVVSVLRRVLRLPGPEVPEGLWGCVTTRGKAGVEFLAKHVQGPASERRDLGPCSGPARDRECDTQRGVGCDRLGSCVAVLDAVAHRTQFGERLDHVGASGGSRRIQRGVKVVPNLPQGPGLRRTSGSRLGDLAQYIS
jgi:repressor LexA